MSEVGQVASGITVRLHTLLVDGPLALHKRRLEAARAGMAGLQIFTLPQLAAHLAGGFARPAASAELEIAVRGALAEGGFTEITPLTELPGMVRAAVRTLDRLWRAGTTMDAQANAHPRLADLALLDARVRTALGGAMAAPDLVRAALARRSVFARLTGDIVFDHVHLVAPVWQPLIEGLAEVVVVRWDGCSPPRDWAAGSEAPVQGRSAPVAEIVSCAHPQAEIIEALRWARELIASGKAAPADIAIVAASPEAWDAGMLGLAAGAGLPVHFSHGIPALSSLEGQSCAALADLLDQGLSYGRVQRLLGHSGNRCAALPALPFNALAGVFADAALATSDQWRRALAAAAPGRTDGLDILALLGPLLDIADQGLGGAERAGEQLLPAGALALWRTALRRAPANALAFTLSSLRVPDGRDPGANIAWGSAAHLAGAPRAHMRLLGLTSRAWPRPQRDDPLLPEHIFRLDPERSPGRPECDRRLFAAIARNASAQIVYSFARRTPQGGLQAPSPLLPPGLPRRRLARMRIPEHAFSNGDRLQARPAGAADDPQLACSVACARSRWNPQLTPWDGIVRADHPLIAETLARIHSASSLRQLLRDPQGFLWRYGLGWHATIERAQTLSLDERGFGDVVHRLLQLMVVELEAGGGLAAAAEHELELALAAAREAVFAEWPAQHAVPPPILWRHTLDKAAEMALAALRLGRTTESGTQSWTEVGFGGAAGPAAMRPWDSDAVIAVPGTSLTVRGRIDRLAITLGDKAARITDYKTGRAPSNAQQIVLAGGAELQRVLYSIAVRHHLPETRILAELVYLAGERPERHKLPDPEAAMAAIPELLTLAADHLRRGKALPGPDARERWNELRLARPASGEPALKEAAIAEALRDMRCIWSAP